MRFVFGKQDMLSLDRTQERCWLLPNGLGGYMSTSSAFSVSSFLTSRSMAGAISRS